MKDFKYIADNFFTHKDFLVPAEEIPGTLFTPLQFAFEAVLLFIIIGGAVLLSKREKAIKPVFTVLWVVLIVWEAIIEIWDSCAGNHVGFDFAGSLPLYPCSIFLYVMPLAIWGRGLYKRIACGYVCTLGMLGAVINFIFPISRLTTYSCISFPGFHTFFFHGTMLFTFLVMVLSGYHRYNNVHSWWELMLPSAASMIFSVPSNIVNYSKINSDYMYFKGDFFVLRKIFGATPQVLITVIIYLLYIVIPAMFYLPSFIANYRNKNNGSVM